MAKPDYLSVAVGLIPTIDHRTLYAAVSILGATVMPHNLYLHSALVQTRRIGRSIKEKKIACHYNLIDCVVALNGAMFVNAAILILAGATFYKIHQGIDEIQQAYKMLAPLMGTVIAAKLFGIGLLASGQSSTLTGTMAGQIVMEGFLNIRVRPWLRRLVTRALAIIPALIVIWLSGSKGTLKLLILSQVVLNLQLPFAIIPLLQFTNDPRRMGEFKKRLEEICATGWGDRRGRSRPQHLAGRAVDRRMGCGRGPLGSAGVDTLDLHLCRSARTAGLDHDAAVSARAFAARNARRGRANAFSGYGAALSQDPCPARPFAAGPPHAEPRRRACAAR